MKPCCAIIPDFFGFFDSVVLYSYSLVSAEVDMTLSPAVLTVDERVKDCSLVLVNLNRIEMGQSEQQDSATLGTKVTESLLPLLDFLALTG